jgi:putative sigma-54 modulation protein
MKIRTELLNSISDANLLAKINQKVIGLSNFFKHIHDAKVVLKSEKTTEKESCIAEVTIQIPHAIIYIKEHSICCEKALDKAIIGLKLQLLRYKAKRLSLGITL